MISFKQFLLESNYFEHSCHDVATQHGFSHTMSDHFALGPQSSHYYKNRKGHNLVLGPDKSAWTFSDGKNFTDGIGPNSLKAHLSAVGIKPRRK